MKTALIIGGGATDPLSLSRVHAPDNLVICADHGADVAWEAGLVPDLIVGDLDSVSQDTLHHFRSLGVEVIHDGSSDLLDTEIALMKAIEAGADRIILFGGWGNRIDQSLSTFGFLLPQRIPQSITLKTGIPYSGEVHIVTDRSLIGLVTSGSSIPTMKGSRIGLIPLPRAIGVSTTGLKYELLDSDLMFSTTMSISNVSVGDAFEVTFSSGELAVIQWYNDMEDLERRISELTGKASLLTQDREYYRTIRTIYDHGGIIPTDPEGKEQRLKLTRIFLDTLVPKHTELHIAHIAGTSGKGSTALFLHHIIARTHTTGLLISPHLHDPNERIQVSGTPIPHQNLVCIWNKLFPRIQELEKKHGVLFLFQEIFLLIALTYFLEQGVEWAVIETGLGGRFDQTSVLDANVTAITQVDLDHTHILGNTIEEIAQEKGGIIRPGIPLVTTETDAEALAVFDSICERQGSRMVQCAPEDVAPSAQDGMGITFAADGTSYNISQPGYHQAVNASLAVTIARETLGMDPASIQEGLLAARLPGRIEVRGDLIIDTGHNPREMKVLSETVRKLAPEGVPRIVVCGISEAKDHRAMLKEIVGMADVIILTKAGYRGEDPRNLLRLLLEIPEFSRIKGVMVEDRPLTAYRLARSIRDEKGGSGLIIVTGSTFLVDEIFNPDPMLREINSS